MQYRSLTSKDFEKLQGWWAAWGWDHPPPLDFLPDNGIMVYDNDGDICAGFIYTVSNAPVAWFTFPVSNPDIRGRRRKKAIDTMIVTIEGIAREMGYKYIYSSLRNSGMIENQKRFGYIEAGINHTELLKII